MAFSMFQPQQNYFPMDSSKIPEYNRIDPNEDSIAVRRAKAGAMMNAAANQPTQNPQTTAIQQTIAQVANPVQQQAQSNNQALFQNPALQAAMQGRSYGAWDAINSVLQAAYDRQTEKQNHNGSGGNSYGNILNAVQSSGGNLGALSEQYPYLFGDIAKMFAG